MRRGPAIPDDVLQASETDETRDPVGPATESQSRSRAQRRALLKNLWWAGVITTAAAVLANLAVREVALAMLEIPQRFSPIDTLPVTVWTMAGATGAVLTFAALVPRAAHPLRTFGFIAAGVLVLSFIPNLWLFLSRPYPGTTNAAIFSLMVMHVVAALVCCGFLVVLVAWMRYFYE